jgi:hypothetical protein
VRVESGGTRRRTWARATMDLVCIVIGKKEDEDEGERLKKLIILKI